MKFFALLLIIAIFNYQSGSAECLRADSELKVFKRELANIAKLTTKVTQAKTTSKVSLASNRKGFYLFKREFVPHTRKTTTRKTLTTSSIKSFLGN